MNQENNRSEEEMAELFGCAVGSETYKWATQEEMDGMPDVDLYDPVDSTDLYEY